MDVHVVAIASEHNELADDVDLLKRAEVCSVLRDATTCAVHVRDMTWQWAYASLPLGRSLLALPPSLTHCSLTPSLPPSPSLG